MHVPEPGLLLEEGLQVDALEGLEAANQGDEGLVICIVCDALQDGHHRGQACASCQHEEFTILERMTAEQTVGPHPLPICGSSLG